MNLTTYGEMDPKKLPYGEMDKKTVRLRRENFNACGQKGASRAILSSDGNGAAQENVGTVSCTLTLDVMRKMEFTKNLRQRTAARPKHKPQPRVYVV